MRRIFLLFLFLLTLGASHAYAYPINENINGGFEQDQNNNNLPDFWETVWRNGTSVGSSASKESFEPVEGKYHFRLYNGSGDKNSYMYALSNTVAIEKDHSYKINASMRYTLPVGRASITIIETDRYKNIVYESNRSFSNGGWQWHDNTIYLAPKDNTEYIQIRFEVGGEEKSYLDIDKVNIHSIEINESFENDFNNNSLPDFWETVWRNGTSNNSSVSKPGYEPIEGTSHLRMYSGTGDPQSFVYSLSDPIPVSAGSSYDMNAFMRYTLPEGWAEITIIEVDSNDRVVTEYGRSMNNGGWKWHYHSVLITPNYQTSYIRIRFAVGGEEKAYLDVDQVSLKRVVNPAAWKIDIPNQNQIRYFYDANGRLQYVLLTNGKIVALKYDKNGSLIKKEAL